MPVVINVVPGGSDLSILESEVTLVSASTPGPAGVGVPAGGTTDQLLVKASDSDYDTEWVDPAVTAGASADDTTFAPAGNIAATDVQAAIEELDAEKAAASHVHSGSDITSGTVADARIASTIARDSEVTAAVAAEASARDAAIAAALAAADGAGLADDGSGVLSVNVDGSTLEISTDALQVKDGGITSAKIADGTITTGDLAFDPATQAELDAHLNDTSDAHDASAISVADAGTFYTATDVEGVLAEIAPQLGAGASDAADVTFTPAGNVAASDVQAAIEELDTEKAAASHTHAESDVTNLTTDLAGKQPLDSDLTAIAALSPTNDDIIQRKAGAWTNRTLAQLLTDLGLGSLYQAKDTTLDTYAGIDPSSNVQSILSAADYAAIRTLLGLVIGTNVQAYDADLTTYAGISPSANVQSLLGAADYAAIRTLLGLVIGTNVQAFDQDLADVAGLTRTKGDLIVGTSSAWTDLAVGTDGHVLTADAAQAAGVKWAAASGGGGSAADDESLILHMAVYA